MATFNMQFMLFICVTCVAVTLTEVQAATEYNRYLAHLFQKYGNGGTMSFEGLEHLMYNLGLGHLEFEPSHTVDEHKTKSSNNANEDAIKSYMDLQTKKLGSDDDGDETQLAPEQRTKNQKANRSHEYHHDDKEDTQHQSVDSPIIVEFKEMHDPKHRHPRENDATFDGPPLHADVCLSPKSLLRLVVDHDDLHKRKLQLYKTYSSSSEKVETSHADHDLEEEFNHYVNYVKLTPLTFMKLCPALLAQIDQQVCMQPAPLRHVEDTNEMIWNAWIYASASIFILSACGLLGILLVPLMKTVAYQEILNFLIAVAVGTLSGDALMHLLPHALVNEHAAASPTSSHDHDHDEKEHESSSHSHDTTAVWICACAFFTAVFMYIIENLLPLLRGNADQGSHGHGHGHSHNHHHGHSHNHSHTNNNISKEILASNNSTATENNGEVSVPELKDVRELNVMLNEAKLDAKKPSRPLTPVAFMVIIGDGLHNLTDGLAIGAAFASAPVTGLATAFAVLCHELPHELGDFALLLQTGVSIRRAIYLNIVSSVLSFVGMAIGLLIAGLHSSMTQWIYAGTAGSFLYIALADLVPAMAAESKNKLKTSLIQVIGVLVGGFIMLAIAINEDQLEKLFK
ncbi:zinc transporter ZIP10 [Musca domestica]|uniref:Zinc transporter ZIP10 n=1 Tax=Musca domestica TaxID=7370 RepID=A0A1I8MYG1_MUSDO|nr:zinc transporter ZIP10 [Musca domestica]